MEMIPDLLTESQIVHIIVFNLSVEDIVDLVALLYDPSSYDDTSHTPECNTIAADINNAILNEESSPEHVSRLAFYRGVLLAIKEKEKAATA